MQVPQQFIISSTMHSIATT